MVSTTSLVAANVRLNEWALQVKDCQNRPHSMKVEEWCKLHGLTKAGYYYRLRRVRKAMLDVMDANPVPEFVKIDFTTASSDVSGPNIVNPVASIQLNSSTSIQITEHASQEFLEKLLRAAKSC